MTQEPKFLVRISLSVLRELAPVTVGKFVVEGPQFRHRVEALVEAFTTLQEDLMSERKAVERQWAKRAAQIERVMTSTSGMFGDLQGIAGKALPEPEGLKLSAGGEE